MATGIVVETRETFIAQVINAITVQPRPFQTERKTLRRQGREELPSRLVASASQRGTRIHTSLTSREAGNT